MIVGVGDYEEITFMDEGSRIHCFEKRKDCFVSSVLPNAGGKKQPYFDTSFGKNKN